MKKPELSVVLSALYNYMFSGSGRVLQTEAGSCVTLSARVRYGSVLSVFHLRRLLGSCLVPGALLA